MHFKVSCRVFKSVLKSSFYTSFFFLTLRIFDSSDINIFICLSLGYFDTFSN
uniref:Macaca fascicularis brain cDNA clone: QflA-16159, similar to human similar to pleckstrin homology domain protein (5V327)(LOC400224), mRNA, RefSeq: XM_375090.1 n=1 Tax=Macaca fascicularis TaxID=9541 RepID=I7GB96_MACFA|nr:unnamed protein product [Macaca fascicularis]